MRIRSVAAGVLLLAIATAAAAQMAAPPRIHNRALSAVADGGRQVFRLDGREGDGVAWWPDVAFTTGTIELDLRGRNVTQASFVGVAFHGVDAQTYEAVYFRPFNFTTDDAARRRRAVQYVSHPAHPWTLLREQHPGIYEKPVSPPPDPDGWFHATIVVEANRVSVFVDRSATAVLEVERLTDRASGWVGLWVGNTSPGDFANVTITPRGAMPRDPSTVPAAAASPAVAPAVAPASAGLSGTYVGQILPDGGGAPYDGRIVIVERGGAVEITLGPSGDELMPAINVKRSGNALSFEANAPGDTPNHLAFEVVVTADALTGVLVQRRDGQTRRGRLVFTKQ